MKQLKELNADYGSNDISNLVEFAKKAPLLLPENEKYRIEKNGTTVNIYGIGNGIAECGFEQQNMDEYLEKIKITKSGIEIKANLGVVEKIVLHSKPYKERIFSTIKNKIKTTKGRKSSESRESRF